MSGYLLAAVFPSAAQDSVPTLLPQAHARFINSPLLSFLVALQVSTPFANRLQPKDLIRGRLSLAIYSIRGNLAEEEGVAFPAGVMSFFLRVSRRAVTAGRYAGGERS